MLLQPHYFIFQTFLTTLIAGLFVSIFYLGLIRFVPNRKIKDAINTSQIVLTIIFFTSIYILPEVLDVDQFSNIELYNQWWVFMIPGAWVASLTPLVLELNFSPNLLLLGGIGVVLPLVGTLIIFQIFSRNFNQRLMSLAYETQQNNRQEPNRAKQSWAKKLSQWLCRDSVEQASFILTWKLPSRERTFKLRTCPTYGLYLAGFIGVMIPNGETSNLYEIFTQGSVYLGYIYILALSNIFPLMHTQFSENFEAAWIYHITPLDQPGRITTGNLKAILAKIGLPLLSLISLLMVPFWGARILDDLLLGLLHIILLGLIVSKDISKLSP